MAAVLGVSLGEHIEFDIVRVAPETLERRQQVVDFIIRQRQPQRAVSLFQRLTAAIEHVDAFQRLRLVVCEQRLRLRQIAEDRLHHTIVQQRLKRLPLRVGQLRRLHVESQDALQTAHLRQIAVVRDVGGFG